MDAFALYDQLLLRIRDVLNLRAAAALLEWDQEVCMPPKGAPARGRQLATLHAHAHALLTKPKTRAMIEAALQDIKNLPEDSQLLLREIAYDHERAIRIPERLIRRMTEAKSAAYHAWLEARSTSNFTVFLPHLELLVDLSREEADCLGYEESPYDALLENYERGMTAAQLRVLFLEIAERQGALVAQLAAVEQPDPAWLHQRWDCTLQRIFTERVLRDMGYDFDAGRQDTSAHPFTTNFSIHDVRITTRFDENNLFSALFGSIHEGGHALYEQGFLETDEGTVLAAAPSLGMHESQSRLWENSIGRSLPFWHYYTPLVKELFPGQLDTVSPEDIYRAVNSVKPSLIRVEADECTYNLHIILRFEIEVALIEGSLNPCDVPQAWNEKMKQYLGLYPSNDAVGCLQDIHWSHGAFGYFPTYALGNLFSAQLYNAILRDRPALWQEISTGDFHGLVEWLRSHVHRFGRRLTATELISKVTGSPPTSRDFLDYLESKYTSLYAV